MKIIAQKYRTKDLTLRYKNIIAFQIHNVINELLGLRILIINTG